MRGQSAPGMMTQALHLQDSPRDTAGDPQRVSLLGLSAAELEQAVRVYAPDLVVLIGDAAVRGGASVVRRMAGR